MYEMGKDDIYMLFGAAVMAEAERAPWCGDEYSHPLHGLCASVFYRPSEYGETEIVCLYRPNDRRPVAYALMQPED